MAQLAVVTGEPVRAHAYFEVLNGEPATDLEDVLRRLAADPEFVAPDVFDRVRDILEVYRSARPDAQALEDLRAWSAAVARHSLMVPPART